MVHEGGDIVAIMQNLAEAGSGIKIVALALIFALTFLAEVSYVSAAVIGSAARSATTISVDGTERSFDFTDDNTGEDLIISTDKRDYSGISRATVYFSIQNKSSRTQSIDINFFFKDSAKRLVNIERLITESVNVPEYSISCARESTASSTESEPGRSECGPVFSGKSSQRVLADSGKGSLRTTQYNSDASASKLNSSSKARKDVEGYVSSKNAIDTIGAGKTAYYKAEIAFPRGSNGKFYIEAIGDAGAYGHLDPWFNSNWKYRKKLELNGSSGAGTGYQMLLRIGESGAASGEDFDLSSHSGDFPTGENDGGDLRFTSADGNTELDFWVEDVIGSAPNRLAYVWVKVADNLDTNKNIYVYYGNASASNESDGGATFVFFDNFDDGAINPAKWTTICSSGCNVAGGVSTSITESGDVIKQFDQAVSNSQSRVVASSTAINTDGYATKRRFRRTDNGTFANNDAGFATNVSSHTDNATSTYASNNNFANAVYFVSTGTTTVAMYSSDLTQNTWYRAEMRREDASQVGGTLWSDAFAVLGTDKRDITISPSVSDTQYPYLRSGDGHDVETDWIFVRKFEGVEPSFATTTTEDVFVNSNITSNTTWTSTTTAIVSGEIAISAGVTLTIKAGAKIKFTSASSSLVVNGAINATATGEGLTFFTSFADDLTGEDSNGNGQSEGSAGDWGGIRVNTGGDADFAHVVIRYGGSVSGSGAMIQNNGGTLDIASTSIAYGSEDGILNTSGTTTILSSDIGFNGGTGLVLNGGKISVTGTSTIHDNVQYGAFNNTSATSSFIATNNYWATASATAATGPHHPTLNPSGTGNQISSFIDFDPWVGKTGTTSLPHYVRSDCPIIDCSSVQNRIMLLDSDTTYTSELTAAMTEWNTLGKVAIDNATSTITVALFQDSRPDLPIKGGFGTSSPDFIFLNSYFLDQNSSQQRQHTIMHELGHALGLDHSFTGNVMNFFQTSQITFGSQDYLDYHFMWP